MVPSSVCLGKMLEVILGKWVKVNVRRPLRGLLSGTGGNQIDLNSADACTGAKTSKFKKEEWMGLGPGDQF